MSKVYFNKYLDDVGPAPVDLAAPLVIAHTVEDAVVVLHGPIGQGLIEAIQLVGSGGHHHHILHRHVIRDEVLNRVGDEQIRLLDGRPQEIPHLNIRHINIMKSYRKEAPSIES